uniref:Uncharacterized protein n=1 Tax=Piliocolobus tephrosceles TaxID=591936 RepID=A0A8C9M0L6_9PRIM
MQLAGNLVLTLPGTPFGKTCVPEAGDREAAGQRAHSCRVPRPPPTHLFPAGNVSIPLGCEDGTTSEGWALSGGPADVCGISSTQQGNQRRQKPLQAPGGTHLPDPAHLADGHPVL